MKKLFIAVVLLISSCQKDDGIGPSGPQGPTGKVNINTYLFSTSAGEWNGDGAGGWWYNYSNTNMNLSGGIELYRQETSWADAW